MKLGTMGQAVDEAVRRHQESYPGSEVYSASISHSTRDDTFRVEVSASHFSHTLVYEVRKEA